MYQLIFSLCISSCTPAPVNRPYESLEACESAKVVELAKAQQDVIKANQLNIIVKFECKQI